MKIHLDQARLDCEGAYLRARDGELLIDELLADLALDKPHQPVQILSTGAKLLLEFFNEPQHQQSELSEQQFCVSGFLAHVSSIRKSNLTSYNCNTIV